MHVARDFLSFIGHSRTKFAEVELATQSSKFAFLARLRLRSGHNRRLAIVQLTLLPLQRSLASIKLEALQVRCYPFKFLITFSRLVCQFVSKCLMSPIAFRFTQPFTFQVSRTPRVESVRYIS